MGSMNSNNDIIENMFHVAETEISSMAMSDMEMDMPEGISLYALTE
jgi:hypothetical protein